MISRQQSQLAVAIRSILIDGDRLFAYAAAGITLDSKMEQEYQEVALKLKQMTDQLR